MNFKRLTPALLLAPLALALTVPHAQKGGTKIGTVNVQSLVAGMSGGKALTDLRQKANTDIAAQQQKIQTLQAKANPTAADRQALQTAIQTLQSSQQSYQKQIAAAFSPLASKVNTAVASAAKAGGFSVVFDADVARSSGLIIYADNTSTNLTSAVQKQLK